MNSEPDFFIFHLESDENNRGGGTLWNRTTYSSPRFLSAGMLKKGN